MRLRPLAVLATAVFTSLAAMALAAGPAALASAADDEAALAGAVNGSRAGAGLAPLTLDGGLSSLARRHSESMAQSGVLAHSGDLSTSLDTTTASWTSWAENVGTGGSAADIEQAFLSSPEHASHIFGDFNLLGVGVAYDGAGTVSATEVFVQAAPAPAPEPAAPAPAPEPAPAPAPPAEEAPPAPAPAPEPAVVEAAS